MTERLAALCEGASGSDRELDCLIGVAIGQFFTEPNKGWPDRLDYYRRNVDGSVSMPGHGFDQMVPAYTASLDAAMTLVPWGWLKEREYRFGLEQDDWIEDRWCARFDQMCGGGGTILAVAATPALALCAASIRARAHTETNDG